MFSATNPRQPNTENGRARTAYSGGAVEATGVDSPRECGFVGSKNNSSRLGGKPVGVREGDAALSKCQHVDQVVVVVDGEHAGNDADRQDDAKHEQADEQRLSVSALGALDAVVPDSSPAGASGTGWQCTSVALNARASERGPVVALGALCAVAFLLDALLLRKMLELHMNDFGKFYYSARAFLDGGDMYAPSPATNIGIGAAANLQFLNMNPPHFHVMVLPFALLPPDLAAILWMVVSLVALMMSVVLIGRELEVRWTPITILGVAFSVLAFSGTQAFFLTGQVSMLLMLAMTVCWIAARRGRWTAAGVWLGICLSVKPFVAIFLPYLIATRRYRAAADLARHGRRRIHDRPRRVRAAEFSVVVTRPRAVRGLDLGRNERVDSRFLPARLRRPADRAPGCPRARSGEVLDRGGWD